jgi:hypothetical protein
MVLTAGEAHIGEVDRGKAYITVSPVTSGSGLYTTGQYIGTSGSTTEVAGVARIAGGKATLESSLLINSGATNGSLEVWMFDTAVVPPANKAAWGVSDADMAHLQAVVPFTTYYTSGSAGAAWGDKTTLGVKCATGSTSLYQYMVSRATASYETGDLSFRWSFIQD